MAKSVSKRGEVVVLAINHARIEQNEVAAEMSKEVVDAIAASEAKDVVLDMGNLEFMSSVGYLPFLKVAGITGCGITQILIQIGSA